VTATRVLRAGPLSVLVPVLSDLVVFEFRLPASPPRCWSARLSG